MSLANFKPKTTAATSLGSLALARLSCYHGRPHDSNDMPLFSFLSSFFRRANSQVPRPITTKLSHLLGSECCLCNWVTNLGPVILKTWDPNT